jgi:hypothetical protein
MDPNNAPTAGWMFTFFLHAVHWLNPMVHCIGLWVGIWAFLRCHKRGYLVVALYFALVLFSLLVMPSISRAYRAHHPPDISEQEQQKMNAAPLKVNFEIGPMVLVAGLWLIARREPNQANGHQEKV